MLTISSERRLFDTPRLFYTLRGNPISEAVIEYVRTSDDTAHLGADRDQFVVFETADEIRTRISVDIPQGAAVALFDGNMARGFFTMRTRSRDRDRAAFPEWTHGTQWGVQMHRSAQRYKSLTRSCAVFLVAVFCKRFCERLSRGQYPWGPPKENEPAPTIVVLPPSTWEIAKRLNEGPDLKAAIADAEYALELPPDSRISWVRIAADPAACDETKLTAVVRAIQEFEVASTQLLREQPGVRHDVFAGVAVNGDPRLPDLYLDPPTDRFSIDRPDLHIAPDGVFASEVDEMPGGFPELVHVDRAYGVNQDRWKRCFDWLFSKGPLLFLVSSEWSKCYIPETSWLVEHLRSLGYPVYLRMTDDLEDVEVDADGVRLDHDNVDIGTIWRQFPIFETTGKLVDLVAAARMGHVRMVPEFGHWGNKVWFSLFRKHVAFFRRALGADVFATLNAVLPDSHLIRSANDFPFSVAQGDGVVPVSCLQDLRTLPMQVRDRLVLKACGASNVTARSKGVRMGKGVKPEEWQQDIDECLARGAPFIVQERLDHGIKELPVLHAKTGPEIFRCRVLMRPWWVGGEVVSAHCCAVPQGCYKVHGMVDMAVLPVRFV